MYKFPSPFLDLIYTCCDAIVIVNSKKAEVNPVENFDVT